MIETGFFTFRNQRREVKHAAVSAGSSGANAIVAAPGAGQKIVLVHYVLSASAAVNAKWQSATTDKTGLIYFPAAGNHIESGFGAQVECAANEALNLNLSGAVTVGGHVAYIVVDA